MTLAAFHGDPAIKKKYIDRIKHHMEMDNLIKGQYWDESKGKGCAIGCILNGDHNGNWWHQEYENQLGIPWIVGRLVDEIFEKLPFERSKVWTLEVHEAIEVGADLSDVWPQFAVWLLVDEKYGVINFAKDEKTSIIIQHVADLYKRYADVSKDEWTKARDNAYAAAAAYSDTAAYAAYAAAAAHAATAAAATTDASAGRNAIVAQAEKLLELFTRK